MGANIYREGARELETQQKYYREGFSNCDGIEKRSKHQVTPENPLSMAVDITRFMPLDNFSSLVESHIQAIQESKKAKGNNRIYLPGEIEAERESFNRDNGVELDMLVVQSINQILEEQGLAICIEQGCLEDSS